MRSIQIGDRKVPSLTEDELGMFLYAHGYCASPDYWHPPEFTEFDVYETSIHFVLIQKGMAGQEHISTRKGIISEFDGRANFCFIKGDGAETKIEMHYFSVNDVAYFIRLGFNFPIDKPKKLQSWPEVKYLP